MCFRFVSSVFEFFIVYLHFSAAGFIERHLPGVSRTWTPLLIRKRAAPTHERRLPAVSQTSTPHWIRTRAAQSLGRHRHHQGVSYLFAIRYDNQCDENESQSARITKFSLSTCYKYFNKKNLVFLLQIVVQSRRCLAMMNRAKQSPAQVAGILIRSKAGW